MLFTITLAFKKLTNAFLLLFVKHVVSIMKNNPVYAAEAAQVEVVDLAIEAFSTAVTAAASGDRTKITIMHQKRKLVEDEVTALARMMELRRLDDVTFYTAPGFEVRKKPTRNNMPLQKPVIKFLKQGTLSGTLDGEVVEMPDGVTQLAIQRSSDGGIAWVNGSYSAGKRFSVSDLESRNAYLVRVCFHGSNQRMSDWSEPMGLFLL